MKTKTKRPARDLNPTATTYSLLNEAYDFFNGALFDGALPKVLISLQRHKGSYGYFCGGRFGSRDGATRADEIALNPSHFKERDERAILSTLVHEQAHVWEFHGGTASRTAYHNKIWATKMKTLGLHPSSTGAPGGKETGQSVSHYIIAGGAFDLAHKAFVKKFGDRSLFVDILTDPERQRRATKKNESKTKFECDECGTKAWAKPTANLHCGDCDKPMESEI